MENRSFRVFDAVQIVAACILLWFVFTMPGPWDWQRTLGTALLLAGVCGIAVARYQLGRSFSIRAQAHQLVTEGVYSKIRNPIYVFVDVMIFGLILALHLYWLFALFPVLVAMHAFRAHREAKVLQEKFGQAYLDYRNKTWF